MPENAAHGGLPRRQPSSGIVQFGGCDGIGLDARPVDRQPVVARAAAPRAGRATVPSRRAGRAGPRGSTAASRCVSPSPIASPSPGGWGAGRGGWPAARSRSAPGAAWTPAAAPPRFWTITETSAAPTRSAAKIRAAGRRYLDGRDLLVLGDAEGRAAAARGHDVRVVHLEPRALERVDVVDARAVDVREALVVDEDAQAVVLEDRVAVALLVEGEVVLEARSSRRRARRPAGRRGTGRRPGSSRNSRTFVAPFSVKKTPLAW